ncbi:hypothetical protein [Pseudaquabacterium pictum]|uniref:Uncharacterized protein n=1 Tax=Pseudaquabacterium pictum TaxID=2315236 RepID=A0A480AY83_9BURK|nr:hypothetical protein [Rubrivivax pictus]GCL65077.1 hypothetical protein AQPW35_41580 [Rubrivivax pictus]
MRTSVPFLFTAASLALLPLAGQAATYQATCQGQVVSASSTAAFGPKCTNVRLITPAPAQAPAKPVVTPTKPVVTPAKPAPTPPKPAPTPTKPVVTPTKPAPAPFDPYKNLYTVQGWANAYKTHGVGSASGSPYYAAAVNKQVVYDANGNFLQARNLGATTRIGSTTYVQQSSTVVNGVIVYTYVKK